MVQRHAGEIWSFIQKTVHANQAYLLMGNFNTLGAGPDSPMWDFFTGAFNSALQREPRCQ